MKHFIFKVENTKKNPSIYGGRKQQATVYQIKNNKIYYVGKTRIWNTASYRGAESEVNEYLLENKLIPYSWSKGYEEIETILKKGKTKYTPYYHMNEKYEIREI